MTRLSESRPDPTDVTSSNRHIKNVHEKARKKEAKAAARRRAAEAQGGEQDGQDPLATSATEVTDVQLSLASQTKTDL